MKRNNSIPLQPILIAVAVILLILLVSWIYRNMKSNSIEITADQEIDITPQQIQSIKDIGEWELWKSAMRRWWTPPVVVSFPTTTPGTHLLRNDAPRH